MILGEKHEYPESHCVLYVLLRHDMRKPQISRDGIAISDLPSLNLNHQYERTSCIVKKNIFRSEFDVYIQGILNINGEVSPYTP